MKIRCFSIEGIFFENEDKCVCDFVDTDTALAILSDGMGGLSLGQEAAEVISSAIRTYIFDNINKIDNKCSLLISALHYADNELHKVSLSNRSNMGAAVAVALVCQSTLFYTWQGNVRLYMYSNGKLNCLSKDHILNIGYGKTALSRCLKGAGLRDDVPCLTDSVNKGDRIFLCSDGFYNSYQSVLSLHSFDDIKSRVVNPEDDASLIGIYC